MLHIGQNTNCIEIIIISYELDNSWFIKWINKQISVQQKTFQLSQNCVFYKYFWKYNLLWEKCVPELVFFYYQQTG